MAILLLSSTAWSQFKEPEKTNLAAGTGFDWLPTISSNLLEAYFVSVGAGFNANWDIWSARRQHVDDPWGDLQPLEIVNTRRTESAPHLSPDGLTLTFTSDEREGGFGGQDLWQSTRVSVLDPWREPVNMGPVINTRSNEGGATFSPDGLEIIYDRGCREPPGVCNLSSLRRSTRASLADPWSEPETMTRSRSEHQLSAALHPSLAPSGLLLYFEARDQFGQHDIFVSERASLDAPFGPGQNLGELVNTRRRDIMPRIAPDGSLYYVRNWTRGQPPAEIWRAAPLMVAGQLGDLDGDGALSLSDLDELTTAIQIGSTDLHFDMDQSGLVDAADLNHWVTVIKQSWIGDANLDGEFNSGDFVDVFGIGKYETGQGASWSEGDWNGDSLFDSGDFVAAFKDGGYEQGKRGAMVAVPEPSSSVVLAIGLAGVLGLRRTFVSCW